MDYKGNLRQYDVSFKAYEDLLPYFNLSIYNGLTQMRFSSVSAIGCTMYKM